MKKTEQQAKSDALRASKRKNNYGLEIHVYRLIANNDHSWFYMIQPRATHHHICSYKNGKILK